ncbi:MAG: PQQ-dependent sugar dehydrogenase [Phycisphaerales bacterium]
MRHARASHALTFFATAAATAFYATPNTAAQTVRDLWADQCIRCHGDRGQGGMAASLLDPEQIITDGSDKAFFDAIKNGMPDHGMPAYDAALTEAEMWGLVVYIRELQHRDARDKGMAPTRDDAGVYRTQHHDYTIEPAYRGTLDIPWAVAWLSDGRMLITERPGRLLLVADDGAATPINGTPRVAARGQGGLLDVAVHPDHANNGWVYLAYSDPDGRESMTKVVRGRIVGDRWTDEQTIYQAPPESYTRTTLHYGCRLVLTGEHLFVCIGERGLMDRAQDLSMPNGKVHRVFHDGRIPEDNPFVDRDDALPTIWSYGHRNPQGMVRDLEGRLWVTEHGPRGGDELNLVEKAANYGWPTVSFGINYNGTPFRQPWPAEDTGITQPVFVWTPSIAACGLAVVDAQRFPKWEGDLLAGGLAGETVDRLRIRNGQVVEREELVYDRGRVRDVKLAPDGQIYIVLNGPDMIVKLVPTPHAD